MAEIDMVELATLRRLAGIADDLDWRVLTYSPLSPNHGGCHACGASVVTKVDIDVRR
jgi:hypothetical protein